MSAKFGTNFCLPPDQIMDPLVRFGCSSVDIHERPKPGGEGGGTRMHRCDVTTPIGTPDLPISRIEVLLNQKSFYYLVRENCLQHSIGQVINKISFAKNFVAQFFNFMKISGRFFVVNLNFSFIAINSIYGDLLHVKISSAVTSG